MLNGERTFLTDLSEIFGCKYSCYLAPFKKEYKGQKEE